MCDRRAFDQRKPTKFAAGRLHEKKRAQRPREAWGDLVGDRRAANVLDSLLITAAGSSPERR